MKKVLVILNLIAGTQNKIRLKELIFRELSSHFEPDFVVLDSPGTDITQIVTQKLSESSYCMVIVAGGDGTVNKAARAMIHTDIPLGIIPTGSGNGLAHHLGIPLNLAKAIHLINSFNTTLIDTCMVNNEIFFCSAGVGFDAHIGNQFSKAGKRGFFTYLKLVIREYWKYKPETFTLTYDNTTRNIEAFLITAANANQWGNNIQIAPTADIQDGMMNLVILKTFSWIDILPISYRLLMKRIHASQKVEIIKTSTFVIDRTKEGCIHFDGEPKIEGTHLIFSTIPSSLRVITK